MKEWIKVVASFAIGILFSVTICGLAHLRLDVPITFIIVIGLITTIVVARVIYKDINFWS